MSNSEAMLMSLSLAETIFHELNSSAFFLPSFGNASIPGMILFWKCLKAIIFLSDSSDLGQECLRISE